MESVLDKIITPENFAIVALVTIFGSLMRWLMGTLVASIKEAKDAIIEETRESRKIQTKNTAALVNLQRLMIEHDTNERLYLPRDIPDNPSDREKNVMATLNDVKAMIKEQAAILEQ